MDLAKMAEHQLSITKPTDDVAAHRKAALELIAAMGEFYELYTRHGAQKQLLALPTAKVINGYMKLAVMRGWVDYLYMWEEAVLEKEEEGLSDVEGALLEALMFLQSGICFNDEHGPFVKAAHAVNLTHERFCFKTSWFVAYITLRVGIGYDFEAYDGEELENLYFDYHAVRPYATLIQEDV